jgi:hypothetical protein
MILNCCIDITVNECVAKRLTNQRQRYVEGKYRKARSRYPLVQAIFLHRNAGHALSLLSCDRCAGVFALSWCRRGTNVDSSESRWPQNIYIWQNAQTPRVVNHVYT